MPNLSWPWVGGLAVAVVMATTGCGVVWDAPDIDLLVQRDGIRFARAGEARELVGGETIITVFNDDGANESQVVLARLDSPDVPADLQAVTSPRDDDRIIGMSRVLDPRGIDQNRGFAYDRDAHRFHIYLDPDEVYVIFDRLGGVERGVVMVLEFRQPDDS